MSQNKLPLYLQVYGVLVVAILAFVPFHAFLSTWFGAAYGFELWWKSWKELLLVGLAALSIVVFISRPVIAKKIFTSRINQLVIGFGLLHFVLVGFFRPGLEPLLAGLAIDLRFFALFIAAQVAVLAWPQIRHTALKVVAVTGVVVIGFGLLQIFVLPDDFLRHFGYSKETTAPFLTVDENPLFVRINSTLRGPNPLGAYCVILASLLGAWFLARYQKLSKRVRISAVIALLATGLVMFNAYSRSAMIGFATALTVVAALHWRKKLNLKLVAAGLGVIVLLAGGLFVLRDSYLVQNVILHENPAETAQDQDSNEEHISSLTSGTERMLDEPFGTGPGSTGSASLYGNEPSIIENYYLFVAHEAGWVGFGLFVAIIALVGVRLFRQRSDWLARGLLASLIGLSVIGLLLPVWADDTVALVWWGLAGIVSAGGLHTIRGGRE